MDLLHLVDRFEELVATAQKMPIGSRVIMDRRKLLDIVDQMRVVIPQEVREARDMVERRDELTRESEEEARIIVARAEEQAARMIEGHAVTVAAREHADRVATEAQQRLAERIGEANEDIQQRLEESRRLATEQMAAADTYSTELLQRLAGQLEAFVRSVRSGLDQLDPESAVAPEPLLEAIGDPIVIEASTAAPPAGEPAPAEASLAPAEPAPVEPPEPIHVPAPVEAPVVPLATVIGTETPPPPAQALVEPEPAPVPIPIHASESGAATSDELENLLSQTVRTTGAVPIDEGIAMIDDFTQPRLDDEAGRE
jgi:bifunctional DNA-binding transcriptional regulator/antitoxin component of YhaV-PrlF toxin-antitoxin module